MLPNLITLVRLIVLIPIFLLLAGGNDQGRWVALGLFLLAGASDVVDGKLARSLGLTSPMGAFLDLVADRLLTLAAVAGLIAAGALSGGWALAGLALVARDLTVAGLNEGFPGRLQPKVTATEKIKVALQFVGLALLIAPALHPLQGWAGLAALTLSAALAVFLTVAYFRRATT